MGSARRLSSWRVEEAIRVIDPVFLDSPQFVCEPLGDELGVRLAIKVETLNPIRSFKGRGTDFLVSEAEEGVSLVCASAGNFGQAMAYSCRKRGLDLSVYASTNANPLKVGRMRALGARVVPHGSDFDEAKIEARRAAREGGARFVEDSLDIETIEGAATMGLESDLEIALPDVKNRIENLGMLIASVGDQVAAAREHVELAESAEAWLTTLRDRVEEVEEDTPEANATRRKLVRLLVEEIVAGRDGDGNVRVQITYRFGPPESREKEEAFTTGDKKAPAQLALKHSSNCPGHRRSAWR